MEDAVNKLEIEVKTSPLKNKDLLNKKKELTEKKDLFQEKNAVIENVLHLLLDKDKWNLPAPKLIISVTGSAQKLSASKIFQNRLKNGLIRTSIGLGTGALVLLLGT